MTSGILTKVLNVIIEHSAIEGAEIEGRGVSLVNGPEVSDALITVLAGLAAGHPELQDEAGLQRFADQVRDKFIDATRQIRDSGSTFETHLHQ